MSDVGYLVAPPLRVDLREERIWLDDEIRHVGRKAFKLLIALMKRPDSLWTKDELIEDVWDGRSVSDAVLTTAMKELRRALNEPARDPRFIKTEHGRGYRFLLPVENVEASTKADARTEIQADTEAEFFSSVGSASGEAVKSPVDSAAPRRWRSWASRAVLVVIMLGAIVWRISHVSDVPVVPAGDTARPSIAVLPFEDYSPDKDQGWFAKGLAEEISSTLSQSPKLRVAGGTAAFDSAQGSASLSRRASELGVEHVLGGSVRVDADHLRVTVQLIRASDGVNLWTQIYDRPRSDIIAVQESIAGEVADALGLAMNPAERARMINVGTTSVKAYEAYLEGLAIRREWQRTGESELHTQSYEAFERARADDPKFSAAHAAAALYWEVQNRIAYISDRPAPNQPQDAQEEFRIRMTAAAESADDEIERAGYEALLAEASLEFRKQLRLLKKVLGVYSENSELWASYVQAAISIGDLDAAQSGAAELRRVVRASGEPFTQSISLSLYSGELDAALAMADFHVEKFPEQMVGLYQAHRAYLSAGDIKQANELLPRIQAGDLPKDAQLLAELRQACAEKDSPRVAAISSEILNAHDLAQSTAWVTFKILGRDSEADDLLRPLDTERYLMQLASFLPYSFFNPASFENLQMVLRREGAKTHNIERPRYFCSDSSAAG